MNKLSNVLPGMMCSSIEFFVVENVVKAINSGKVIDFNDIPIGIVELLREEISKDENVKLALLEMHPDSEWKRIEQFVKCRLGGLDYQGDIKEGVVQDGEYWDCPKRGTCAHEGVVCRLPVVNNHRLTHEDIKLMQFSSTEMTNEVIAEEMEMPMGSYHKQKAKIHNILGVQTKQGITKASTYLGLI
jgi:hypothetical protein